MSTAVLPAREAHFLSEAARYLEKPSYLMRLADAIGAPVESLLTRVVPKRVAQISESVLRRLMALAASSLPSTSRRDQTFARALAAADTTGFHHKLATVVTGGVAGAFGLPALALELPLTTSLMFRSIAATACEFGHDLRDPSIRLECLAVFSQGGPTPDDDALESTYLTARLGMSVLIQDAARFLGSKSAAEVSEALARGSAPVLLNFLSQIARSFNLRVSEKLMAQSLPLLSIGSGALINAAFTDHFNRVARFHFGIRQLEREYGAQEVQALYQAEVDRVKGLSR